jgi:hypothetical protein
MGADRKSHNWLEWPENESTVVELRNAVERMRRIVWKAGQRPQDSKNRDGARAVSMISIFGFLNRIFDLGPVKRILP